MRMFRRWMEVQFENIPTELFPLILEQARKVADDVKAERKRDELKAEDDRSQIVKRIAAGAFIRKPGPASLLEHSYQHGDDAICGREERRGSCGGHPVAQHQRFDFILEVIECVDGVRFVALLQMLESVVQHGR